jgi:hypothetical protein
MANHMTPQQQQAAAPSIADLDSIPNQLGHAVVRASDGTILRPPTGTLSERDVGIVWRLMLEIGTVLEGGSGSEENSSGGGEGLQRVTVGFGCVNYAVGLWDGCLYVVKKRSS